jgi:hypothetical protein
MESSLLIAQSFSGSKGVPAIQKVFIIPHDIMPPINNGFEIGQQLLLLPQNL